jgi:hypothetical protein
VQAGKGYANPNGDGEDNAGVTISSLEFRGCAGCASPWCSTRCFLRAMSTFAAGVAMCAARNARSFDAEVEWSRLADASRHHPRRDRRLMTRVAARSGRQAISHHGLVQERASLVAGKTRAQLRQDNANRIVRSMAAILAEFLDVETDVAPGRGPPACVTVRDKDSAKPQYTGAPRRRPCVYSDLLSPIAQRIFSS